MIYLDHAATSQKPRSVLDALQQYYGHDNANVHRGAHQLSARATEQFEAARDSVARFIGAASAREIVYTRNASEAINLVARTWGEANLRPGDEVLTFVARNLEPYRGFPTFMRALPALQRAHPDVRVLIVGENSPGYGDPLPLSSR